MTLEKNMEKVPSLIVKASTSSTLRPWEFQIRAPPAPKEVPSTQEHCCGHRIGTALMPLMPENYNMQLLLGDLEKQTSAS